VGFAGRVKDRNRFHALRQVAPIAEDDKVEPPMPCHDRLAYRREIIGIADCAIDQGKAGI
jgi:hypothetical protein